MCRRGYGFNSIVRTGNLPQISIFLDFFQNPFFRTIKQSLENTEYVDSCLHIKDPPVVEKTENSSQEKTYGKYRIFNCSVLLDNAKISSSCYVCSICESTYSQGLFYNCIATVYFQMLVALFQMKCPGVVDFPI